MLIHHRHVTTLELRDNQTWSFFAEQGRDGWRITAIGDVDVLYLMLPSYSGPALAQACLRLPSGGVVANGAAPGWRPAWSFGSAWVDRKQVTTVNLSQPHALEVCVQSEGADWRVSFVRADVVVHLLLGPQAIAHLRQAVVAELPSLDEKTREPISSPRGAAVPTEWLTPPPRPLEWLAYN
jgi:hypothetical protein